MQREKSSTVVSEVPRSEERCVPALHVPGIDRRDSRWLLFLLFAIGTYVLSYLLWFLATPLGRFPALDGAENIELARKIATGALPASPFYRAMLYPGLLSLFFRAGVAPDWLPVVAGILGLVCHVGSTFFVYSLGRRIWSNPQAGLVAAVLFGFNPVAVYFAAEPLDTTLGLFLFLGGAYFLYASLQTRTPCVDIANVAHGKIDAASSSQSSILQPRSSIPNSPTGMLACIAAAAVCLTLAMLARPHFAIVLAGVPLILVVARWRERRILLLSIGAFVGVAALLLVPVGLLQKHLSGGFRIMPTQGAYSLWAGNRPGANGRYYEQKIHIPAGASEDAENPARIESEILYRQETGDSGPLVIDSMNAFWKTKTVSSIRAEPLAWLGLMVRKVYYLFNNFEQYNNKTFAVQKALSPVFRWNPLCWGLTLVLCVTSITWFKVQGSKFEVQGFTRPDFFCPSLLFLSSIAALYSFGVVLFFVSDRFRLPLLPFLCIGAGAWGSMFTSRAIWLPRALHPGTVTEAASPSSSSIRSRSLLLVVITGLAVGLLTFSRAWGVYDLTPVVQDYLLLSIAAGNAGDDSQGLLWARRALEQRPDHPDALARAVTSFFNMQLRGAKPEAELPQETWGIQLERVAKIPQPTAGVRLVQAVAYWKLGRTAEAQNLLNDLMAASSSDHSPAGARAYDDALGVLLLSGLSEKANEALGWKRAQDSASFYLITALARREAASGQRLPSAQGTLAVQAEPLVQNIFPSK